MMVPRVLVTGATGWLGRRLLYALRGRPYDPPPAALRDAAIRILVQPGAEAAVDDERGVEVVAGDVRDVGTCARFCAGARDAILFHVAGAIHPRRVREFYEVNVDGTVRLLDAAVAAGVRRVVALSSSAAAGVNPHPDHRFDEASFDRPYMHYGRSKLCMERAIFRAAATGRIETVVIRAPWFYGPGQPARQTLFFRMVRDGKAPIVGRGDNLRSLGYVDDLCRGLLLAALAPAAAGRTYWIADERPYAISEIVDTIEHLLDAEFGQRCAHRRLRLPAAAGTAAWLGDRVVQAAGLYHQRIHVLSEMGRTIACSIDRAREELGYLPEVALEEGMRRSLRWVLDHGGL